MVRCARAAKARVRESSISLVMYGLLAGLVVSCEILAGIRGIAVGAAGKDAGADAPILSDDSSGIVTWPDGSGDAASAEEEANRTSSASGGTNGKRRAKRGARC